MGRTTRTQAILAMLEQMYPDARCELNYRNPFELLIATILSAQTTDQRVNEVTADLFQQYPTPERFLTMTEDELAAKIRGIGLFRNKSRHILQTCRLLVEQYNGQVPADREALESLPGVGRKTANVVLSNAFGIPAIAVDTHVFRVANRLGLANSDNVRETEEQLMRRIPKNKWSQAHHWLIWHGRRICHARNPRCTECLLLTYCPYGKQRMKAIKTS